MAQEENIQSESGKEKVQAETEPAAEAQPKKRSAPRKKTKSSTQEEGSAEDTRQHVRNSVLLFGKYSYAVEIKDPSLRNYVNLTPIEYPLTFRRGSQKQFSKADINIIERLENSLMRGGTGSKIGGHVIRTEGRLQGKKQKVLKIIESAFDRINQRTHLNPVEVLVRALENSAPIEDTTRVRYGGIISNVAVDVSASRRLDIALRNVAIAAIVGAFKKKRKIDEALADELVMAANNDVNSYATKRKNEIERMARSAK